MSILFYTSPIHIFNMSIAAMQLIKIQLSEAPLKIKFIALDVCSWCASRVARSQFYLMDSLCVRKIVRPFFMRVVLIAENSPLARFALIECVSITLAAAVDKCLTTIYSIIIEIGSAVSRRGHVRRKRSVAHHRVLLHIYNVLLPFEFRVWKTTWYRNAVETCDPPPCRRSSLWPAVFLLLFVMLVFFLPILTVSSSSTTIRLSGTVTEKTKRFSNTATNKT